MLTKRQLSRARRQKRLSDEKKTQAIREVRELHAASSKPKRGAFGKVCDKYGVPARTLRRWLKNGVQDYAADVGGPGRRDAIPRELATNEILPWVQQMHQSGRPISQTDLCKAVGEWRTHKEYVDGKSQLNVDHDGNIAAPRMSDEWCDRFMLTYNLSLRKPSVLKTSTAFATEENILSIYPLLQDAVTKHNLLAHQIWNCDETHLSPPAPGKKVIVEKGTKTVNVHHDVHAPHISFNGFINAAGGCALLALVPQRAPQDGLSDDWKEAERKLRDVLPAGMQFKFQATSNGWQTTATFVDSLRFLRSITQGTQLVLFDAHSTHIGIEAATYARNNNIILIAFPSNVSVLMQPLDKGVYSPFKDAVTKQYNELRDAEGNVDVVGLVEAGMMAWKTSVVDKPPLLVSAFNARGLFPVDPSKAPAAPAKLIGINIHAPNKQKKYNK